MKLQLKLMIINVGKQRIQDSMFYFLNLKELIWSYNSTWWPATFTRNSPLNIRNVSVCLVPERTKQTL